MAQGAGARTVGVVLFHTHRNGSSGAPNPGAPALEARDLFGFVFQFFDPLSALSDE